MVAMAMAGCAGWRTLAVMIINGRLTFSDMALAGFFSQN
jgi:hypothetical protein